MAAELIKIYKDHLPSVRLIGKRYTKEGTITSPDEKGNVILDYCFYLKS